jgi:FkbM family methyltransferase
VSQALRELLRYAANDEERTFIASQLDLESAAQLCDVEAAEVEAQRRNEADYNARMERRLAQIAADESTFRRLSEAWHRRLDWKDNLAQPAKLVNLSLRAKNRCVPLSCPDTLESFLIVFDVFAREVYRTFPGPLDRIYDLGAHAGIASLYLFACHPEAEIVAVEPIEENLPVLEDNLARSRARFRIIKAALETAEIHSAPEATCLSSRFGFRSLEGGALMGLAPKIRQVRNLRFADLDRSGRYGVKIDIEGSEHALVDSPGFAENARWIVGEIHLGPKIVELGRARALHRLLERTFQLELAHPGIFGDTITYGFRANRRGEI